MSQNFMLPNGKSKCKRAKKMKEIKMMENIRWIRWSKMKMDFKEHLLWKCSLRIVNDFVFLYYNYLVLFQTIYGKVIFFQFKLKYKYIDEQARSL